MKHEHRFEARLQWRGSTGAGYENYDRTHRVSVPPAGSTLTLSSDPTFLGDAELANPEQLLVAAASSCRFLKFLAIAARSSVDVLEYESQAEAVMPESAKPMRITQITLRPRIVVAAGSDRDRVRRVVEKAHAGGCFVTNTLNADILVEPTIEFAAAEETTA